MYQPHHDQVPLSIRLAVVQQPADLVPLETLFTGSLARLALAP